MKPLLRMRSSQALAALGLAVGLCLLATEPAFAQWKWKDGNGRVQYSDLPPPQGVPDKDILQRPASSTARRQGPAGAPAAADGAASAASAPVPVLAPKGQDPELEARRRKTEQEDAARKKAEADKMAVARAENCKRARAYAQQLDEGLRISRTNDKGEREFIDDRTRAEESRRAREVIANDCR
jgi:hypothetical protein